MAGRVTICEVGPRDGLQNEPRILSPDIRAELCRRLAATGLQRIEAVSFVREDRVPTMAGAEKVIQEARNSDFGATLAGLILNERGYERALAVGVEEVHYAFPVTDTSAKRNQGTTVEAAKDLAFRLIDRAKADGVRATIALAVAFGCPYEGHVSPDLVLAIAKDIIAVGPGELALADSIGVAVPRQVRELVGELSGEGVTLGCHFHNTRNTGYANALVAVEAGATVLDASLGGLGGCPFMPGATGNIATEDLVYLLEGMGYTTGVSLDELRSCSAWLTRQVGHELPGLLSRAGDPCGIVPRSGPVDGGESGNREEAT